MSRPVSSVTFEVTGMRTYEDFLSIAVYCRDRVNPNMFIYALSVAILHRPDTKDLPIPPLTEVFPDKYVDSGIFSRAREEANVVPEGSRVCKMTRNLQIREMTLQKEF